MAISKTLNAQHALLVCSSLSLHISLHHAFQINLAELDQAISALFPAGYWIQTFNIFR